MRLFAIVNRLLSERKTILQSFSRRLSAPSYEEVCQPKTWFGDNVRVLLRLDSSKLNYENNPRIHRADHDFQVAWSKMHGKGRVFYSTLGHTEEVWEDPDVRKMYFEAIKWSLEVTEGSTASHAKPAVQK